MYNTKQVKKHFFKCIRNPYAVAARFRNSAGVMRSGKKRFRKEERHKARWLVRKELYSVSDEI